MKSMNGWYEINSWLLSLRTANAKKATTESNKRKINIFEIVRR